MDSESKSPKKQSLLKRLLNDKGSMSALVVVAFVGIIVALKVVVLLSGTFKLA